MPALSKALKILKMLAWISLATGDKCVCVMAACIDFEMDMIPKL